MKHAIKGGLMALLLLSAGAATAQRVMLDNYFNQEVDARSGKAFHYLWSDTANSGFSQWGEMFRAQGAALATLREAPRKAQLAGADIYLIVDPDTRKETPNPHFIGKSDIRAISSWVKKGGVLVLMANDSGNCEFDHLNRLAGRFGLHFNEVSLNHVTGRQWEMGAITNLPASPLFAGVRKIYMKETASISLQGEGRPLLEKDGQVLIAQTSLGKGHVLAIADPWIYNEYIDHAYLPASFENKQAALNLTAYLLQLSQEAHTLTVR